MLRISLYVCGLTILLFTLVGLSFHSSPNPILLNKYSVTHCIVLFLLILSIVFLHKVIDFFFSSSKVGSYTLTATNKVVGIAGFLALLFGAAEFSARNANREEIQSAKLSFLKGYHPFLQNRLGYKEFNSHEFRGVEITKVKPKDTYRIFTIGGSSVLSARVPHSQTHAAILEDRLNQHSSTLRFEVQNAGNHWHTSQHSLIKYLFRIKDYAPDMIVFWHGINDLLRSCPASGFQWGKYRSDYGHYFGALSEVVFQRANHPPSEIGPLFDINLASLVALKRVSKSYLFSDFKSSRSHLRVPNNAEHAHFPLEDFVSQRAFARNLDAFVGRMQLDGVKLVLATQAHLYKEQMNEKETKAAWMRNFCKNEGGKSPDTASMLRAMNRFNLITREVSQKYRVPLVDLEKSIPKELTYFLDDIHYTSEGNKLIGEQIYRTVSKLVPQAKMPDPSKL